MIRSLVLAAALSTLAFQLPVTRPWVPSPAPFLSEMTPGERATRSLAGAWPERIEEVSNRDGDWMLRLDGRWFAWAHGRLLPEEDRDGWRGYAPQPFYEYPRQLPELPILDAHSAERVRASVEEEERHPPRRSEAFMGALLKAPNRASTESRLVKVEVAGFTVTVHERLHEPLARVSRELAFLKKVDPDVARFLRQLSELNGYNYRYVDGTRSRSLHSYGTAIDLIPKRRGLGHSYWRWAMNRVPDWWTIPYDERWMPPTAFVRAFERQGFVWGGKWFSFDTMHFEYRPEIFIMRTMPGAPAGSDYADSLTDTSSLSAPS